MNIIIRSSSAHFHDTKIAYVSIRQSDDLKSSYNCYHIIIIICIISIIYNGSSIV